MKNILALILLIIGYSFSVQSQTGFKYQAIARDAQGNELVNKNLTVQLSVISGDATGLTEWQESHSITTNAFGLYDLVVGDGSSTGNGAKASFNEIEWSKSEHFLKIEVDFGTGMLNMGTIQLLAVPYALYAKDSRTEFSDNEFQIINEANTASSPMLAPSAALAGFGPGNLENGTHDYKVTFTTNSGETGASPSSNGVIISNNASNGQIMVSKIPNSSDGSVIARNIYRRYNESGDYKLVAILNDNVTTAYVDNIPNSSLSGVISSSNNTLSSFSFDAGQLTGVRNFSMPDVSGRLVVDTGSVSVKTVADRSLINHGRSVIKDLINGDYIFSADGGEWGEAYVDIDGRFNTVISNETNAYFKTNKYISVSTSYFNPSVVVNSTGWTDVSSGIDDNLDTYSYRDELSSFDRTLGGTFDQTFVFWIKFKSQIVLNCQFPTNSYLALETYDGSIWTEGERVFEQSGSSNNLGTYYCLIGDIIQGARVRWYGAGSGDFAGADQQRLYELSYSVDVNEVEISHTISSGRFSDNLSSCFGTFLSADWEEGAAIQYKLVNDIEDSGWLKVNEAATFTAFTREPTKVIVKLIPKASSPTAGFPAINGFYITEF